MGHQAPMMEAARTSETSVAIQLRTRKYIPEDSELHLVFLSASWNYKRSECTKLWTRNLIFHIEESMHIAGDCEQDAKDII
jgi:hypothetical protein